MLRNFYRLLDTQKQIQKIVLKGGTSSVHKLLPRVLILFCMSVTNDL